MRVHSGLSIALDLFGLGFFSTGCTRRGVGAPRAGLGVGLGRARRGGGKTAGAAGIQCCLVGMSMFRILVAGCVAWEAGKIPGRVGMGGHCSRPVFIREVRELSSRGTVSLASLRSLRVRAWLRSSSCAGLQSAMGLLLHGKPT